jgi:5-formyltetrahydrofolate cyclo-ligase
MKQEVRKKYLTIRREQTKRYLKSAKVAAKIFTLPEYTSAKTVAIYYDIASEVSTDVIRHASLAEGKRIALPKTFGDHMHFYSFVSGEPMERSYFGVWEPLGEEEKLISPEEIDLIIVPGLAFDRELNRLGFGRGFYDRYLSGCSAFKVGICYDAQIAEKDEIPIDCYDVKMDMVITEKEIIV